MPHKLAFLAVLFLAYSANSYAYKCGVQIDKLMEETYKFSQYSPNPDVRVWPLNIEETRDTEKFDNYYGVATSPEIVALYIDAKKRIIIHEWRDFGLTETQSCAVMVHELCHHLQNIHGTKEKMTVGQREAECYLVQKNYIVYYADQNWAKRGNPMPLGPNGFQTVKEFKMLQRAKAANQASDFDPSEYDCEQMSLKHENVVCTRHVSE